ncbi:TPA: hypothetical protein DDW35_03130, partial [Candidatus Sumerlaeota bacterium]|nr:hypothetical protein [Candidatus Sumerlaeota bacterium]
MRSVYAITLFVVSLVFALGINYWAGKRDLEYDEVSYQSLAEKYAETGVYGIDGIQAYRAPIYPMTLGVLYRCFGKDVVVGRIYQSVLSALMVALTYLLGDFLYSRKTGILAAGLLMLDSFWWLNQTVLTQENLVSVMTMISILLVLFSMQAQSVKKQISLMAVAGFSFWGG